MPAAVPIFATWEAGPKQLVVYFSLPLDPGSVPPAEVWTYTDVSSFPFNGTAFVGILGPRITFVLGGVSIPGDPETCTAELAFGDLLDVNGHQIQAFYNFPTLEI